MSIRRLWPVAAAAVLVGAVAAAPASSADPPPPAQCTVVGPTVTHPTTTSTEIDFAVLCTAARAASVSLEIEDGAGGTFALVSSTSDIQANGTSSTEIRLPVFVPRACLTVDGSEVCAP